MKFHNSTLKLLRSKIKENPAVFDKFCQREKMTKQAKSVFKSKVMAGNYKETNLSKLLSEYGAEIVIKD